MTAARVSVVMPIYNTHPSSLHASIKSILSQTYEDFEFLIVNDSPDNTELDDIVESYGDSRIIYSKNSKNVGLEASTNRLIRQAGGEYIAIFDHDDISMPNRLELEVAYLDKHPEVGLVSGQFEVFGNENAISNNPTQNSEIKELLCKVSCVSHTACMIRKSVIEKYNLKYEKKYFPAASYRMITRLALVTKVHNLSEVLVRYRMDGSNTSLKYAKKRIDARDRVQRAYSEQYRGEVLRAHLSVDTIHLVGEADDDHRRYYRVTKGGDTFFVKTDVHDFKNEYMYTKKFYNKDTDHAVEPISHGEFGQLYYYMSRWCDGVGLDAYLQRTPEITKSQRIALARDMRSILFSLRAAGIVHRDIIPRNLIVDKGRLKIIDFYFTVSHDDYREYEYIQDDVGALGALGESFAAGVFHWDDVISCTKVIEYIAGAHTYPEIKSINEDLQQYVGSMAITPKPEMFLDSLVKLKTDKEDLQERLLNLEQHLSSIEKDKERLVTESDELRRNIHDIHNSRSYKAIQSIRGFLDRFR